MSNVLIGLLVAASVGTWIFTKQMRRSGQNTKSAVIVGAIAGIIAFVVVLTIAITIDGSVGE
jgi:uncharacterized protein YqgC (DUF456 family)